MILFWWKLLFQIKYFWRKGFQIILEVFKYLSNIFGGFQMTQQFSDISGVSELIESCKNCKSAEMLKTKREILSKLNLIANICCCCFKLRQWLNMILSIEWLRHRVQI